MKLRLWTAAISAIALSTATALPASAGGYEERDRHERNRQRAVELRVDTTADTTDVDVTDGRCGDAYGACSLRAAIQTSNNGAETYRIKVGAGDYHLSLAGAGGAESGDLDIHRDVVINGRGAVIDLSGLGDRAFDIAEDTTVSINRLTVRNAALAPGESGGAFRNAGVLLLDRITATHNVVVGEGASGGAILNTGEMNVVRSTLSSNGAARAGGAIEAEAGNTAVILTTMSDNTAGDTPGNGGALHLTGEGTVLVAWSTVTNNHASSEGGGLWNSATGTMVVDRTSVSGNTANGAEADQGGGGLFNDGGTMLVSNSKVAENTAPAGAGSGGGIFNNGGVLDVNTTDLTSNSAQRAGGGIETVNGTVVVNRSTFSTNVTGPAPGNGGALHASGNAAMVEINRSTIVDNVAALEGGGLWAGAGDSVMTVRESTITGNVANGVEAINGGGGLFNKGGALSVENSTIASNSAPMGSGSGGGILNLGTLAVLDTVIEANGAARAGGGIESNDVNGAGNADLVRVQLANNVTGNAPGNGGGMHVTGPSIVTTIDESTVTGNRAATEGGGLWNFENATMTVTRTVIKDNAAPTGPDVFQNGAGGNFTVDGVLVPAGSGAALEPVG